MPKPHPPANLWQISLAAAGISAAALAAYHNTFSVPLLYDDNQAILNNQTIRHLGSAFSPPGRAAVFGRPLLNVSLAINYSLGGTAVWGYHALNLAIHILAALTLFGIIRRTCRLREEAPETAIAFSAAILWTLHPLQTGAVTYIVQRAESLMGLYYLLTLYGFIRGAQTGDRYRWPWFALSIASCLFGMATKEVMATAPLIVLLYDRTFVAGSMREAFRRRWSYYALLAATWLLLGFLVVSAYGRGGAGAKETAAVWWRYALTQLPAIAHYLRLCFWPYPLIFDYGTAVVAPSLRLLPYGLIVVALMVATLWALIKRPAVGFLGACFFAILAPTSSFVPVAGETMADYRMYLPSIPVIVLVVLAIYRYLPRAALPVCLALAACLGLATVQRNRDYTSEEAIWSDVVAKLPGNYRAHANLGNALSRIPGRLPDAIAQFEAALQIDPDFANAHNNLGLALATVPERIPEAIAHYEAALRIKPDYPEAHNNLGAALAGIPGRLPDAIAQFEAALAINADYADAHNNLGAMLAGEPGRLPEAITHFEAAVRIDPNLAQAHLNLGNALQEEGGHEAEARAQFDAARRLNPDR
jgi:tetratricopeptide (TPR) repeat protein